MLFEIVHERRQVYGTRLKVDVGAVLFQTVPDRIEGCVSLCLYEMEEKGAFACVCTR